MRVISFVIDGDGLALFVLVTDWSFVFIVMVFVVDEFSAGVVATVIFIFSVVVSVSTSALTIDWTLLKFVLDCLDLTILQLSPNNGLLPTLRLHILIRSLLIRISPLCLLIIII